MSVVNIDYGPYGVPLYRCVPGAPLFLVDAFRHIKQVPVRGVRWFLTHFHADHYGGLTVQALNAYNGTLLCTPVTAALCQHILHIPPMRIRTIPLHTPIDVDGVTVTALDANHCPGSAMILFQFPNGHSILHTGDMRYSPRMKLYPELHPCSDRDSIVDELYLDTTYCNPKYVFPPQEDMVLLVAKTVREFWDDPNAIFLVGTYKIGKERVLIEIARVLQCKIYASREKLDILRLLDLKVDCHSCFTSETSQSRVHIVSLGELTYPNLDTLAKKYSNYSKIIGFRPTGWTFNSKRELTTTQKGNITIHGVPYSEHSSFNELLDFVEYIRPKKIIPTVNSNTKADRLKLVSHFSHLMDHSNDKSKIASYFSSTTSVACKEEDALDIKNDIDHGITVLSENSSAVCLMKTSTASMVRELGVQVKERKVVTTESRSTKFTGMGIDKKLKVSPAKRKEAPNTVEKSSKKPTKVLSVSGQTSILSFFEKKS